MFEHPGGRLLGTVVVVVIDIVFRDPTPDSSLTEPILSPCGEAFLPALGILEILTLDAEAQGPVGGLHKYVVP